MREKTWQCDILVSESNRFDLSNESLLWSLKSNCITIHLGYELSTQVYVGADITIFSTVDVVQISNSLVMVLSKFSIVPLF